MVFTTVFSFLLLLKNSGIFYYNYTTSMPIGLYLAKDTNFYKKGDIVIICPPKKEVFLIAVKRGYLTLSNNDKCWITPLMKIIVGFKGDYVEIEDSIVAINGLQVSVRQKYDGRGRLMPAMKVKKVLDKNELFLLTKSSKSFDSRYFGVVESGYVLSKVVPLITFDIGL